MAMRIDRADRILRLQEIAENTNEPTGAQFIGDQKCWQYDQALPMNRSRSQGIGAVRLEVARYSDRLLPVLRRKAPFVPPRRMRVGQAIMGGQVRWSLGNTPVLEIARRTAHCEMIRGDAARDEARLLDWHMADGQIEPLLHQVDHLIGHAHADRRLGIEPDEFLNDRCE